MVAHRPSITDAAIATQRSKVSALAAGASGLSSWWIRPLRLGAVPLPLMIWSSSECESWPCSAWRRASSKDSVPTAATSSKARVNRAGIRFGVADATVSAPAVASAAPPFAFGAAVLGCGRDRRDGIGAARHVPYFDPQALGDRCSEHEGLHHAHADALRCRCRGNGAVFLTHPLAVLHVQAAHGDRIVADVERCPQLGLGAVNAPPGDRGQQVGAEPGLLRQLVALAWSRGSTPSSGAALRASSSSCSALGSLGRGRRPDFGLDTFEAVNIGV